MRAATRWPRCAEYARGAPRAGTAPRTSRWLSMSGPPTGKASIAASSARSLMSRPSWRGFGLRSSRRNSGNAAWQQRQNRAARIGANEGSHESQPPVKQAAAVRAKVDQIREAVRQPSARRAISRPTCGPHHHPRTPDRPLQTTACVRGADLNEAQGWQAGSAEQVRAARPEMAVFGESREITKLSNA